MAVVLRYEHGALGGTYTHTHIHTRPHTHTRIHMHMQVACVAQAHASRICPPGVLRRVWPPVPALYLRSAVQTRTIPPTCNTLVGHDTCNTSHTHATRLQWQAIMRICRCSLCPHRWRVGAVRVRHSEPHGPRLRAIPAWRAKHVTSIHTRHTSRAVRRAEQVTRYVVRSGDCESRQPLWPCSLLNLFATGLVTTPDQTRFKSPARISASSASFN